MFVKSAVMPYLWDHCHLSFAIKANFVNRDSFETSAELILTEYNRLFWNIKSKDRLKDGLKSQTDESTTPKAECFYCFEVFGTPDEKRGTSF